MGGFHQFGDGFQHGKTMGLSSGEIKYHPQTYGYNWNLNVQQPSSNTFQFFDFVERCFFSRNHDAFHMKGLSIVRLRSTS